MRTTPILSILLTAVIASAAHAKDLGVQANIWPIIERDMREVVLESASETDWNAVNDELIASAKAYPDSLAKRSWPVTQRTETTWMDPSVVLTSDVQAPVKRADGELEWQVMVPKGTKANPLEKVRPTSALFFFDGADDAQLELVAALVKVLPGAVNPIEAGQGSVLASNKRLELPVFHASDEALRRFQIRSLPTLVYPGDGAQALNLGITQFAAPYSVDAVVNTWEGFKPALKTSKAPE